MHGTNPTEAPPQPPRIDPFEATVFGANAMRVPAAYWIVVAGLFFAAVYILTHAVSRREQPSWETNYRIPYRLAQDYWLFRRYAQEVAVNAHVAVVGDSVIWGHYVRSAETLTAYLNQAIGSNRFHNLAVDGVHPVALNGLIRYYGTALRNGRVLAMFNPLWITSPKQDLREKKEFSFNHPDLVPQFFPRISCYVRPVEERIGAVIRRHVAMIGWADHLRMAYLGGKSIGTWSLDHPYENPLTAVTFRLPSPDEDPDPKPDPRPWYEKGLSLSPSWVFPTESFQWASFVSMLETLQARGNRLFVLVNPMNEHMMTETGRQTYRTLREAIGDSLRTRGVPFCCLSLLPRELYADSSHPVAAGYARMAQELQGNPDFVAFCQ